MIRAQVPTLETAVHVVPADCAVPRGRYYIALRDNLAHGPCADDPYRHSLLRTDYWRTFTAALGRKSPDIDQEVIGAEGFWRTLETFPRDLPLVVWTTRTWVDRLSLWWTLDTLRRFGGGIPGIWIAESVHSSSDPTTPDRYAFTTHSSGMLITAFSTLTEVTTAVLRAGAEIWSEFSRHSPLDFDAKRRAGTEAFPDLQATAEMHGAFFPRLAQPGKLRLSLLDEAVLETLREDDWTTAVEVIQRLLETPTRHPWLQTIGDLFVVERLVSWAKHNAQAPLVLGNIGDNRAHGLTRFAFRLAPQAKRRLTQGFQDPHEVPPLHVGGCAVYTAPNVWVRCDTPGGWTLQRWPDCAKSC